MEQLATGTEVPSPEERRREVRKLFRRRFPALALTAEIQVTRAAFEAEAERNDPHRIKIAERGTSEAGAPAFQAQERNS